MSFQSPNYTQVPNELFDKHMAEMSGAELKVVLVAVRKTVGYHKKRQPISLSQFMELTGLSRQGVLDAVDLATEHGFIKCVDTGVRGVFVYELSIDDFEPALVKKVDRSKKLTGLKSRHTKEKILSSVPKEGTSDRATSVTNVPDTAPDGDGGVDFQSGQKPSTKKVGEGGFSKAELDAGWDCIKECFPNAAPGLITNYRGLFLGMGKLRGEWQLNRLEKPLTLDEMKTFAQWRLEKARRTNCTAPTTPETLVTWVNEWRAQPAHKMNGDIGVPDPHYLDYDQETWRELEANSYSHQNFKAWLASQTPLNQSQNGSGLSSITNAP